MNRYSYMKDVAVLVLAGGSGTRFWPFTTDKLLFPFLGKPLIERSVLQSIPKQANKVVIVTNNRNHDTFASLSFRVPHFLVKQEVPMGMADAVKTAAKHVTGCSLLILIADDMFDTKLPEEIIHTAINSQAFGVIPGWKPQTYFPGGYLVFENNQVKSIVEKPGEGKEPSPYVTFSGHFIEDADVLLETLSSVTSGDDDVYEKALTQLMKEKHFVFHEYKGSLISLKYPWHVLGIMDEYLKDISSYKGDNVIIKPHVVIDGPVYIGNNVKIMEFSKIVGPAYIGDNTIIGNNNVIRFSMIGNNCVTGFSTDITRSYVGDNCWFHSNYIGDSVLESNVSMGSGTVLANLKLDEGFINSSINTSKVNSYRNKLGALIGSNVRIGVNTSTMPGIKIGSGSFIGAGITINQDIPNNSFVNAKSTLSINQNNKQIEGNRDQFKKNI